MMRHFYLEVRGLFQDNNDPKYRSDCSPTLTAKLLYVVFSFNLLPSSICSTCVEMIRHLGILSRLIPESPRWLLSQKKTKEAISIVESIAKRNKRLLPENLTEVISAVYLVMWLLCHF